MNKITQHIARNGIAMPRRSHIFSPFRSQLYFLDFAEA